MSGKGAERRAAELRASLPDVYRGEPGLRRSGPGLAWLYEGETGFYTVAALFEFLQYEIDGHHQTDRNERFVSPICLVAMAVDGLAEQTDPKEREATLDFVSKQIRKAMRKADRVARYEDEFVALLRRTLAKNVQQCFAQRIAQFIAEAPGPQGRPTTLSLGIASLTEHLVRDPGDMLKKAQRALLAAKRQGPGSVAVYDFRVMPL